MKVKPIPEGFHTVTPYIIVDDPKKAVEFVKKAFDAKEIGSMKGPDGNIMHAMVDIGDSRVMFGRSSEMQKAMPSNLYLYFKDADAVYKKAIQAGATSLQEPINQFYGDRCGGVKDPTGNQWGIATKVEELSPEEMQKENAEIYGAVAELNRGHS